MGPDEDTWNIDNNVYTNVAAAINLYFGDFAACVCRDALRLTEDELGVFSRVAKSIALLYDEDEKYHPQFEGFNGTKPIKQADVVLIGYPLQLPMDE